MEIVKTVGCRSLGVGWLDCGLFQFALLVLGILKADIP